MTRNWLAAVFGAAALIGFGGGAQSADVVLKLAHEAPATAIKGRSADKLAELVEKYSNGTVKINVFPGGQLVPTTEEIRAAVRGQVDIIAPYTSYYSAIDAAWDIFYQPFLFKSPEQAIEVFGGPIGQTLLGKLDQRGLKGLSIWHDGPVYAFTKGEPALTPDALKGQKVRVAPSKPIEMMLQNIGATSITMPATEVYLALQQGVVNGVITTPTYTAPARWGEVLTTMTRALWGVGGYGVAMNKRSWERMDAAQQEAFMRAVKEVEKWNQEQTLDNIRASEAALASGGMKILDLTTDQRQVWTDIAKNVWAASTDEVKKMITDVQQSH
ncbi:TRAP transporter substrate-binding protein [Microvirga massiliensis]|uniref:TRAP transporter substrate-binding protein n=1 Tax=Microvirga massiliensis TaxID=1033741 RepID=UPI00062B362B|nr:TRAP transporter substrate-binding protein [Microvirga massiliensis]